MRKLIVPALPRLAIKSAPLVLERKDAPQLELKDIFAKHVDAIEEGLLMAGDERWMLHQIRASYGFGSKAEVRDRDGAGFLGIVHKITLRVRLGIFGD